MSWVEKSLDELGFLSRGKSRHRPRDAAQLYGGPYPFVQTGDVKHAGLYLAKYTKTYSEEGLAQSKLWPVGTLCITIAANIADTSILKIEACFPDSIIGFIPDKNKADARFIKYLFDAVLKLQYQQFSQGAAQDNLSQGKLLSIKFKVPKDVAEQIRIANLISKYDLLIENNYRRIQLLEESAKLLFQEWFINRRFPGHELAKSNNGLPKGWTKGEIASIASVKSGFAFKSKDWQTVGNPVIKIKNITKDSKISLVNCQCVNDSIAEKAELFEISSGDLLIAMTGATVGKVGVMPKTNIKYYLNQRVGRFSSTVEYPVNSFLYCFTTSKAFQANIQNLAGGAAQPNISGRQIESIELLIPPENLLKEFDDLTSDSFKQRQILIDTNEKLSQARDLLLPKIMSGEITV